MPTEVEAIGTGLFFGSGTSLASPGSWTEVTKVLEINPPEEEAADIQNSHLKTGISHTFQPGMSDPGEFDFTIHQTSAQLGVLRDLYRVMRPWKVECVDGTTITYMGYLKTRGFETIEIDALVGNKFSGKVSGAVEVEGDDGGAGSGS